MCSLYGLMEAVNDIVLFRRIRQDDRLALNTLFENYYQQLCRFACSCSLSTVQAEEVVSDVFFILWKNRERIDIHSNVRSYLYRCVRNAALEVLRQARPEVALTNQHEIQDVMMPDMLLEYQELDEQIGKVIENLPERCRQVFVMNRFDLLTYKEIGQAIGISEKTVEHHMVKALEIIRSKFPKRFTRSVHKSVIVS
jgi:RNA polymerase sigma-70 factor, ECF subfamily